MGTSEAANYSHFGMGTKMAHRAFGVNAADALRAVEEEAGRLEHLLSRFIIESDVGRINRTAGLKREKISSETLSILKRATEFSNLSDGLFDVTIGPLIDLWDYKHAAEPPVDNRIREVLKLVGWRFLELDEEGETAGLVNLGQSIDLGGIGKGYASDCFVEVFKEYGVKSAFSNIGGNVSTLGEKPDGTPWQVGIRHPRNEGLIGAVSVSGKAVVTSGDYERYFTDSGGRRYHHILNPVTGYPAESGLISVTIIADRSMDADALSTAIFIAGLDRGLMFLEKCPWAESVLVDKNLEVHATRGLRGYFEVLDGIKASYI